MLLHSTLLCQEPYKKLSIVENYIDVISEEKKVYQYSM